MSYSSSSSSLLSPVVPQHCLNAPLLYEFLRGEEEISRIWLRAEMNQIPDPIIDSLFTRLIMSSSPSAVAQSRLTVSELCGLLEGEKVEVNRVLQGEMARLVNSLFERLTNKLRANEDWHRSEDAGDRAQVGNRLDQVESHNAQSHQVKREIEEENEMELKNMVDKATQANEQIENCVKQEIKEEEEDGEETRLIDIETLTEDSQSGAGDDGETTQLIDCLKQEFKEEFDYGHEIEIKQEEDGTINDEVKFEIKEEEEEEEIEETDEVVEHNEGGDENEMNPNNVTHIDTLFDRSMRDEVELDEPTRTYHELMPVSNLTHNADTSLANASTMSNEAQPNLTNREDENEDQVDPNPQHQFDDAETNINNGGMMQIDEEEKVGDGQTRVTDTVQLAVNEGDDGESSSVDAEIGTTSVHLTRQSQANINKSARHDKRKLKVPQTRNEPTNRDNQHEEDDVEKGQIDEVSSRRVKRPRMDTTQANNAQAEVTRHYPRQATDEVQSNQDRPHEEGDRMASGHEPIGQDIATECTTNPTQSNLAQSNCRFQCQHCHKSCVSMSKLQRHLRVHTGERPFPCDQCEKRFKDGSTLAKHQLIHQNIKNFRCNECEKEFTQKCDLDTHLLIHSGERPFECRHCEKSFTTANNRNTHEQAIHLHAKPHRCKQCGHTATQRSDIIKHIRVVHFRLPKSIKVQQELNIVDDRDPRELLEKV